MEALARGDLRWGAPEGPALAIVGQPALEAAP
jgi:hypothetical protein